jgi:hypothetical protein
MNTKKIEENLDGVCGPNPLETENSGQRLQAFIAQERDYFTALRVPVRWEASRWDVSSWLFHRGGDKYLTFYVRPNGIADQPLILPKKMPLPLEFADFCKAMAVFFQRTRGLGYAAVRVYVDDCRRLYNLAHVRKETSPTYLTAWHFEETLRQLDASDYSGIYDTATRLQAVASIIDRYRLTINPVQFIHDVEPTSRYLRYVSFTDPEREEKLRRDDAKLPSAASLEAYAVCTNNPRNGNEEVLLRTIDLLIAMGQRGNEVSCIPVNCWIEKQSKDESGRLVTDTAGTPIVDVGIRYYPLKHFETRIHWFADQDVPLARRAVERLLVLTADARAVARWQENHCGRLWAYSPEAKIHEDELLQLLCFSNHRNLYLFLAERNGVVPCLDERPSAQRGRFYRAGDIEAFLAPKLNEHVVLKAPSDHGWKVILRTSETLSIRFDGAFRFVRAKNEIKVLPQRVTLRELNVALGAIENQESIFDRRFLFEEDGKRIKLTTHQPRHWRNTLYALAGMSNAQQALAMGRKDLSQNIAYQHTTILERTENHDDYLAFNSVREKMTAIHDGIRNKKIIGDITRGYHYIKDKDGLQTAEQFLLTHAQAMHFTPFGACGHDFSQAPCPKHLQCWNECTHLHRTNAPSERTNIKDQIEKAERNLLQMREIGDGDFGAKVWITDLERKLENMRKALSLEPDEQPIQVFPLGHSVPAFEQRRQRSSVDEE